MSGTSVASNRHLSAEGCVARLSEYNPRKIINVIRRYKELRSATEITAARYEKANAGGGFSFGKDDILCMLADIDQGITTLPARQLTVLKLLAKGYKVEEIARILGLRPTTVSFHMQEAILRLVTFLNKPLRGEKGAVK